MRKLSLALALMGLVGSAKAAVFYEPFDYQTGDLHLNVNPGSNTTWYTSATSGADDRVQVTTGNLSYTGLPASVGNMTSLGGAGRTDRIQLPTTYTSGSVYYSILFKVTDLTGTGATGASVVGFNNTPQSAANDGTAAQPSAIAGRLLVKSIDANTFQVGASKASGTAADFVYTPVGSPFNLNDTIFVVGRYNFNTGSTTDDTFDLWVNPSSANFGNDAAVPPPTLTATTGADGGQIATFILRQTTAVIPAGENFDELRVDTSWARVTSNLVPEPGMCALLAIAGATLMARRKR